MARKRIDDGEAFNSDSFLDIIANVVGILIILVIAVGVRVSYAPSAEPPVKPLEEEPVIDLTAPAQTLRHLERQSKTQQTALTSADQQHQELQTRISSAIRQRDDQKLKNRRLLERIEQKVRQMDNLQLDIGDKQQQLASLWREMQTVGPPLERKVTIENYPSPISRAVYGEEAHFQLLGGHVVHVPFKELVRKFQIDARRKVNHSPGTPGIEAMVGPVGDFNLRYILRRIGVHRFALDRFTFIPKSDRLGEPVSDALMVQSRFRQVLASYDPNVTTITIWTYPDSFAALRLLKKAIYLLGYSVAARPLPFGKLISGSPDGSRSAAQ